MTLAALYLTVFRMIHIFSAVTWVGGAIFVVSVLMPTVQAAGPDGGRFMMHIARLGRLSNVLTLAALGAVAAGLLPYWPASGGLNGDWLKSAHGLTLTIGALIGIAALLHGIFATGPITRTMGVIATDLLKRQGPPPPEMLKEAQGLAAKLGANANISMIMGALALLFMAAAPTL